MVSIEPLDKLSGRQIYIAILHGHHHERSIAFLKTFYRRLNSKDHAYSLGKQHSIYRGQAYPIQNSLWVHQPYSDYAVCSHARYSGLYRGWAAAMRKIPWLGLCYAQLYHRYI